MCGRILQIMSKMLKQKATTFKTTIETNDIKKFHTRGQVSEVLYCIASYNTVKSKVRK